MNNEEKITTIKMQEKVPSDYFGEAIFSDRVMRTRLQKSTYRSLKQTIEAGEPLNQSIAGEVAAAMKQWALEKGATHYTHWFMPMTGNTAEKHDAFIETTREGQVVLDFSGSALTRGEPDASSFPSGGLRETAKARGYTAWDCTSPAFVKDGTLYIPTAFFSYTGEILDKKAPLLRSIEALSTQSIRILRALGHGAAKRVMSTVGPEQEYFLVDKKLYDRRQDLMLTGRTLFGAPSPKGQELADHYYSTLKPRIMAYMHDLDIELWRLGISAKTRHNEVAPSQHELAIIFDPASVAADHNQLVMEMMKKVAERHGLVCLLHEKPYAGVSGSGKHINWSLSTDEGENILDPGSNPAENTTFLLFLSAVMRAVDEYAEILLVSVASAGNEHRLGAHEAPPAIISMFIGDELQSILDSLLAGTAYANKGRTAMDLGVKTLSLCTVDQSDRNRTSPFAFTGNRFEFRMCGSQMNIAGPCFTLNAIIAHVLEEMATELEAAEDKQAKAREIYLRNFREHRRIIFNGNNYGTDWPEEAARRGLSNVGNAVKMIKAMKDEKNIRMYEKTAVLSRVEIESRYSILLEIYTENIRIEARTAIQMVNRQILPAVVNYLKQLSQIIHQQRELHVYVRSIDVIFNEVGAACDVIYDKVAVLSEALKKADTMADCYEKALFFSDEVRQHMGELRQVVDSLEIKVPEEYWPLPSYMDMMFRV